jgi:diguanylate cyclase (GGDEF)-like protein
MSIPLQVLFVAASQFDTAPLLHALQQYGYNPSGERVENFAGMAAALARRRWEVIISDCLMPSFSAFAALALYRQHGLEAPFIVVSSTHGEDCAIKVMQAGAHDFLTTDNLTRLGPVIERELRDAEVRLACKRAQGALRKANEDLEAKIAERTRAFTRANAELKKANHKLEKISREDALTGLLNRRVILEAAAAEWTRWLRCVSPFSVMIIDVDNFKAVNDRYGHLTGDRVLALIGGAIPRSLRAADKVGRYGGEEFVIVMPETGIDGALAAARNLVRQIRQLRLRTDDLCIQVTVSIGVAASSLDDKDLDGMLHRADTALYTAKRQGKDRVVVSEQQLNVLPELLAGELYL